MLPGELIAIVTGGGLGFTAYSYRRYDTLTSEGYVWLKEYFVLQKIRQAAALSNVLRFVLPELVESYFDSTPPEEPVPMPLADLENLSREIADSPESAPNLERHLMTEHVTRVVLGLMRDGLDDLVPGVVATPAVTEGMMGLRTVSADSTAIQHRMRFLSEGFRVQAVLGGLFTAGVVCYALDVPYAGYAAVVGATVCVASSILLELSRDRLRESLRLERTPGELARS